MTKNTTGGKKHKLQKNKNTTLTKRILILPEHITDTHAYISQVSFVCGNSYFRVKIIDKNGFTNEELLVHLSKGYYYIGRVLKGSFVLITKRDYENKGDIIMLYNENEIMILKNKRLIPDNIDKEQQYDDIVMEQTDNTIDIDTL